ncbi:MAG TPA: DUF3857 domain-containing protein [Thermoanaerobaculia bacterium]|nr:DUF3857 domain-containing protein [Thermoanaerobaculia bacterium]
MKHRFLLLSAFLCLFVSQAAEARYPKTQEFRSATAEELAMTSVPGAPGAEAAILDWVRVDDDTNSSTTQYFRMKIFSEEGKKHADIELTYTPGHPVWGSVTDIQARTIRPDGSIVPFNGKIYDKIVLKVGRSALRAKTFSLPDVQPGSIIEYRYTLRWSSMLIFSTLWSVQRDIPVLRSHFTLIPYTEGDFNSMFTYMGLPAGKAPQLVDRKRYELKLENMPALRSEAFAPPEDQLRARVNFFYLSSSVKPDKFWEEQVKVFAKDIEKFIGNSKSANELAKKLSAEEADRAKLLRKIYAHTQSLRNLTFEESKTTQEIKRQDISEAKNVEEVLRKGSGFSHEINRTFVAIARAAGFDADAVRVASRDDFFFSDKLPDSSQMDAEVAMVTLDGKPIHLDPGTPLAPFSVVSWEKTNVPGIHVTKGAKAAWKDAPGAPATQAVIRRNADLTLNGDNLEGTVSVTFSGQEALIRRLQTITEDDTARKKALEDEVKAWFPDGATLTEKSVTGDKSADDALVVTYDVVLPNVVSRAGSRVIVPISVFRSNSKNPFAPTERTHAIYYPYPNMQEDVVKLTLPADLTVATLPKPLTLNGGVITYDADVTRQGNVITYKRAASVSAMFIPSTSYTSLRRFYGDVLTADQQPLVLTPVTGGAK